MRISVRKDNPGYRPDAHKYEVFLDGQKVEKCFTADEETGQVMVYVTDESGKIVVEGNNIFEKTLTGKVEIRKRG